MFWNTYVYKTANYEKRGQEFEEEQGGIDGKVWREKREGRHVVILISNNLKRICHLVDARAMEMEGEGQLADTHRELFSGI